MDGFGEDLCGFSKELFFVRRELPRLQAQVSSMREDMSKMQKKLEEAHNFQVAQKLDPEAKILAADNQFQSFVGIPNPSVGKFKSSIW